MCLKSVAAGASTQEENYALDDVVSVYFEVFHVELSSNGGILKPCFSTWTRDAPQNITWRESVVVYVKPTRCLVRDGSIRSQWMQIEDPLLSL